MLRCGCMGMSVGKESFATDPIPYRFVRKPKTVSGSGMDIMQKPGTDPSSWKGGSPCARDQVTRESVELHI
ncbi:unnamed protein product [Lasius platythorax]|uniref:Uncharacterized protein n=1 Tax=Lasius platythorax TaxID=488582 RepID=A0AAV2NHR0_9HYME